MITGDSYIGSNRQHRLSDQVSANTASEQLIVFCPKLGERPIHRHRSGIGAQDSGISATNHDHPAAVAATIAATIAAAVTSESDHVSLPFTIVASCDALPHSEPAGE